MTKKVDVSDFLSSYFLLIASNTNIGDIIIFLKMQTSMVLVLPFFFLSFLENNSLYCLTQKCGDIFSSPANTLEGGGDLSPTFLFQMKATKKKIARASTALKGGGWSKRG